MRAKVLLLAGATALLSLSVLTGCTRIDRPLPQADADQWNPLETFPTSLHATARGMETIFNLDGGGQYDQGFGTFSGIDYQSIGCKDCHASGGPDRDTCAACHENDQHREPATCYKCHGRQGYMNLTLGEPDVHRTLGFGCVDCHKWSDYHGDGNIYASQLDMKGARVNCEDCHVRVPSSPSHDAHIDAEGKSKLHCVACHTRTIVSCYNCHFDTFLGGGGKKAAGKLTGWVLLVNDTRIGKIKTGTFQTIAYEAGVPGPGDKFIGFVPFESHTIMDKTETASSRACTACHGTSTNLALQDYQANLKITATWWTSGLNHMTGIIPVIEAAAGVERMEFVYLGLDGGGAWTPLTTTTVLPKVQYAYCSPITQIQLQAMIAGPKVEATLIAPATGVAAGGETITITGTGFWKYTTVTIDGVAATDIIIIDSTSLTCVTPAGSAGIVDVVFTNAAGFTYTFANSFTYN